LAVMSAKEGRNDKKYPTCGETKMKKLSVGLASAIVLGLLLASVASVRVINRPTDTSSSANELQSLPNVFAANAGGPLQLFLRIEGVPGESTDKDHKNWIDVVSYNWGLSMSGDVVQAGYFNVTMGVSKASPKLLEYAATGKHSAQAILCANGPQTRNFLCWYMEDVWVGYYRTSGSGAGAIEQVGLDFCKIRIDYVDSQGNKVSYEWTKCAT